MSTTVVTDPGAGTDDAVLVGARGGGRWGFGHVPALDGLRGAAVAGVLAYHAGHLTGGYLGVDLFFVISGYLITSLLLAEHLTTTTIALRSFWVRRARRLLPAVLLLLVGIAVYARVVARPVDLATIRGDGLATLFYVANWRTILHGSSYWDISLAPSPLQHTWSLAIEEQFYLVWPLAVVGLARLGRGRSTDLAGRVLRTAVPLSLLSVALFVGLHHAGASTTRLYEGTDTRAAALLFGVVLAALRSRSPRGAGSVSSDLAARRARLLTEASGIVAAVLLATLWVSLDGQSPWLYRGGLPLASLLATVVLAAAAVPSSPVLGRVLSVAPLRWLGLISYGLYLWHWPIYQTIDQHNGSLPLIPDGYVFTGPGLVGLKVVLSVVAAIASYVVLEQPIRHGAFRGWAGGALAAGGMAVAAVAILWGTAGAVDVPDNSSMVGQPDVHLVEAPTMAFVGDSVAQSIARPVVEDPGRYGVNPVNLTRPGCSIVTQGRKATNFGGVPAQPAPCLEDPAAAMREAKPDVVFLLLGARPNDFIQAPDGAWVRACDPRFDEAYRSSTRAVVQALGAGGRPVVLGTIVAGGRNALVIEGAEERSACVNKILQGLADELPNGHLVDLSALVCPDGPGHPCREDLDGAPIRTDGLHYDAGEGGARVADWVVARSLEAAGLEPGS